jgi:lipopolysaccharide exporter
MEWLDRHIRPMEAAVKSKVLAGIRWTGLSQILTGVIQFAQIAILAHWLTPTEFGLMAMVLLILTVVSAVADGGVSAALIHVQDITDPQRSTLYWLHLGLAALFSLVMIAAAPLIAQFSGDASLEGMIRWATLSVMFAAIGTQFRMFFHKELRFGPVATMEIAAAAMQLSVAWILAAMQFGAWSLLIGHISGTFVGMVWMLTIGLRHWKPTLRFELSGLTRFVRFGVYNMGEKLILFLGSRIDQLVITSLFGLQWLGLYSMALNLVIYPIQRINATVTQVTFPLFARHQDDRAMLRGAYLRVLRALTLLNAPLLAGVMVTAPVFVPTLFGPQWGESVYIIQVLCLYAYHRSTGSPAGSLLQALGRTDLGFHWNLLLTSLTVPVIWWGGTTFGIPGMLWGMVGLHTVMAVAYYPLVIKRLIGDSVMDYTRILVLPVLYAAMMGAALRVAETALPWGGVAELVILLTLGIILYSVIIWFLEHVFIRDLIHMIRPIRA